jgi:hypothetical protein
MSKMAESAATDMGAGEREEAGAKMSLPPTAGWDIGCPTVRPFSPILFSSVHGTKCGPFFMVFSRLQSLVGAQNQTQNNKH